MKPIGGGYTGNGLYWRVYTDKENDRMNKKYLLQWFEYILENPHSAYRIATSGNIVPIEFSVALDAILALADD